MSAAPPMADRIAAIGDALALLRSLGQRGGVVPVPSVAQNPAEAESLARDITAEVQRMATVIEQLQRPGADPVALGELLRKSTANQIRRVQSLPGR